MCAESPTFHTDRHSFVRCPGCGCPVNIWAVDLSTFGRVTFVPMVPSLTNPVFTQSLSFGLVLVRKPFMRSLITETWLIIFQNLFCPGLVLNTWCCVFRYVLQQTLGSSVNFHERIDIEISWHIHYTLVNDIQLIMQLLMVPGFILWFHSYRGWILLL